MCKKIKFHYDGKNDFKASLQYECHPFLQQTNKDDKFSKSMSDQQTLGTARNGGFCGSGNTDG